MRVSQDSICGSPPIRIRSCDNHRSTTAELAAKGDSYNIQYHFSPRMSNTPLCHHIKVRHALFYLEQAEKHGWVVGVKFAKAAFTSGYTFKTLRHVLTQPGVKLDDLPPPPPPDPSDCLPMDVLASQKPTLGANLPPFTIEGLKNYLVHYLVANDLVHIPFHLPFSHLTYCGHFQAINKIESPELCQLILYCCPWDITDSNIPHRTKTHELILDAFATTFTTLKVELLVSVPRLCLCQWGHVYGFNRQRWEKYHSPLTFGQVKVLTRILLCLPTGSHKTWWLEHAN